MVEADGALPKANMPRVALPAAEPFHEPTLAAPTPHAVEVQEAYVYLLRIVLAQVGPPQHPRAKIPLVPSLPPVFANNPTP